MEQFGKIEIFETVSRRYLQIGTEEKYQIQEQRGTNPDPITLLQDRFDGEW